MALLPQQPGKQTRPSSLHPSCPGYLGLSVHLLPPGALTLGTIFVSGFMITLTRSGLSTKRSLQTTPPGGSRYVDRRLGSGTWPVREEEGEVWEEWWGRVFTGKCSAVSPWSDSVCQPQLHFIRHYLAEVKKGETISQEDQRKLEEDLLVEANR